MLFRESRRWRAVMAPHGGYHQLVPSCVRCLDQLPTVSNFRSRSLTVLTVINSHEYRDIELALSRLACRTGLMITLFIVPYADIASIMRRPLLNDDAILSLAHGKSWMRAFVLLGAYSDTDTFVRLGASVTCEPLRCLAHLSHSGFYAVRRTFVTGAVVLLDDLRHLRNSLNKARPPSSSSS